MRGERVSCLRTEGSPSFNSIDLWEPESLTVHDTSSWCWWCDPWHKYCVTSPDRDRQSSHPAPPCWSWLQGVTANHLSDMFVLRMFINEPQQQRGQWRSGGQAAGGAWAGLSLFGRSLRESRLSPTQESRTGPTLTRAASEHAVTIL